MYYEKHVTASTFQSTFSVSVTDFRCWLILILLISGIFALRGVRNSSGKTRADPSCPPTPKPCDSSLHACAHSNSGEHSTHLGGPRVGTALWQDCLAAKASNTRALRAMQAAQAATG